jgi:hypothetical protein
MRIGAKITTVGAHDAHCAAARPTGRCLIEAAGPQSWPGGAGGMMNASDHDAAEPPACRGSRTIAVSPSRAWQLPTPALLGVA